jgi:hypothetical protein
MKVFVVLEDDRGMGVSVEAVCVSKERAEELASASSHYWVEEMELDEE